MIESDKNIQELFRGKLDHFESPVNQGVWEGISSHLPSASGASGISGASTWNSLWVKVVGGIAAAGITASAIFFVSGGDFPKIKDQVSSNTDMSSNISESAGPNAEISLTKEGEEQLPESTQSTPTKVENPGNPKKNLKPEKNTSSSANDATKNADHNGKLPTSEIPTEATPRITNPGPPVSPGSTQNNTRSSGDTVNSEITETAPSFQVKEIDDKRLLYFFFCGQEWSSVQWRIDGEEVSRQSSFNHLFDEEGEYNVEIITADKSGNTVRSERKVEVIRGAVVNLPNAFSPGNDGMNDYFDVEEGVENEKEIHRLTIRSRPGDVIYDSDTKFVWDGRMANGDLCEPGTYSYVILFTDKKNNSQTKTGTLRLFRE